MTIPTARDLAQVFADTMDAEHTKGAATTAAALGRHIIDGIAAVRDAVLEGVAQEAEKPMIGYGASDDEGDAVAAWLRSRKGDQ